MTRLYRCSLIACVIAATAFPAWRVRAQSLPAAALDQVAPWQGGGLRLLSTAGIGTASDAMATSAGLAGSFAVPLRSLLLATDLGIATEPDGRVAGAGRLGVKGTWRGNTVGLRVGGAAAEGGRPGLALGTLGATIERAGFSLSLSSAFLPGQVPATDTQPADTAATPVTTAERRTSRIYEEAEAGYTWHRSRWNLDLRLGSRIGSDQGDAWWASAGAGFRLTPTVSLGTSLGRDPGASWRNAVGRNFITAFIRFDAPFHASPRHLHPTGSASPGLRVTTGPAGTTFSVHLPRARSIEIAGDFDDWQPLALNRLDDGTWTASLALAPGVYHVSIRIDGARWTAPPGLPVVPDELGGETGVFEVS